MKDDSLAIHGKTDARFNPVRDAFADGFEQRRDVGAGVAVTLNGTLVVDLWAGFEDRKRSRPWSDSTLCCLFSVSKALSAICVLQAVAEGLLDLDRPVPDYWPEFGQAGKSATTVRHVLAHRAGLIGFHEPVSKDIYYDWSAATAALAAERPWWRPGEAHGYHARTLGFLLGELLRRAAGRGIGQWLRERIAAPRALDVHIGLAAGELTRCADMLPARIRPGEQKDFSPAARQMMADYTNIATPTGAAFSNPALGPGYMNSHDFRVAELPALNGHGTARSVALLFGALPDLLPEALVAEATTTHSLGPDQVLISPTHFGLGFMLYHDESPIGVRPGSYGHAGAGGSMAFHDPQAKLGFCYAMNQMEQGVVTGGVSATRVAEAVYDCL